MKTIALTLIRVYQMTASRVMPPSCRFVPSCSQFGHEAIDRHGFLRGGWMTVRRIARCNPLQPGGYDPVP